MVTFNPVKSERWINRIKIAEMDLVELLLEQIANLNLQSSDTTIRTDGCSWCHKDDQMKSGTDSILIASKIKAFAEGEILVHQVMRQLSFHVAGTAGGGKMVMSSTGNLTLKSLELQMVKNLVFTLQTGDTDIAQDDVLGQSILAPDEGTGTDAILVAAGIAQFQRVILVQVKMQLN